MKPVNRTPSRFLIAGTVAATFSIVPPSAFAATFIKANNTTALNAAGSYTINSGTPAGTDIVQFDSTVLAATAANAFNTGANVTWGQLSITNPGAAISIANNTITLNGVGGVGIDMSSATQDLTITSTVSAFAAQAWNIGTGRTLTVASAVTNPGNVTLAGAGNFTTTGNYTTTTNNTLGGTYTQFGNTLTVNGAGQFSGLTNLVVTSASTVVIGATSGTGVANRINTAATLTLGGVAGGGTFTLAAGATGPTNTQTLAALNVASGSSTINNTNGVDTLVFTGTSGAGFTRAVGGFVNFATANSASFTNAPTALGGSSVIGSGGNEILVGATLADADFIAAGSGNLTAATYSSSYGTGLNTNVTATGAAPSDFTTQSLHFGTAANATLTLAGVNTVESGMILNGINGTQTITGGSLQPSAGGVLTIYTGNAKNYNINSVLSDNSGSGFERYGAGTVTLNGNNTFTGQIYLAGGTTNLGHANALGAPSATANLNIVGTTNLNLSGTSTAVTSARNIVISGGQTLSVNTTAATNSMTLSGTIGRTAGTLGAINIAKNGLGTLYLTGNTVGTPNLGLSFNGGNLDVTGQIVTSNAGWNWNGGTAGATVTVHGNGILQNAGDLNVLPGNTAFTDINLQDNGQIILGGRAFIGKVSSGQTATVNINQSGGLFQAALFQINSSNAGAINSVVNYNLNGGIMRTNGAITVDSNSALNLNGGTVNLTGNNTLSVTNTQVAQSGVLGKVVVQSGGGIFNVNNTVTYQVSASLTHDGAGPATDGGLTKIGAGTLNIYGTNTYTGATTVKGGILSLDYSQATAPLTNIVNTASSLVMSGGQLTTVGKASTVNSQTFAGTTLNPGANSFVITNNATANTVAVNLGAITRNTGATVNFAQPTVGSVGAANGYTTSRTNDATGILGTWSAVGSGTNLQYASNDGTNVVAYAGATAATANLANVNSASTNYSYNAASTLGTATTANTLRYTGGATTTALGSNTLTVNGIMNAGSGALTISGAGSVLAGSDRELVITANTQNTTISSVIGDSVAGSSVLTYRGGSTGATLTLNAANTFTGGTFVNAGTLAVGATGTLGSGDITLGNSVTLTLGNASSINDIASLTFSNTSTINLSFSGTETIGNLYNSFTNTYMTAGASYTASQLNTFFGTTNFTGAGLLTVTAVPEPSSWGLLGVGASVLAIVIRRRRRSA